ncbi:helix-turn-helix domain-containing protein [Methylocella tundrae]|uniref:Transcriptional regulator, Crp/Fnr family n=1 Tax=Methylocella tundrae TaxID=227605 RepID=A0A4U8Z6N9_METTU|nr:helix-turn-helix domain-containing protein [Methylocella tundrae]WPP04541.1 helix-turn-helix domain-containing protein [Methylocella tundrae]VFU10953.1 Transcriptional regulator, Crp/Fnr family [Methylocella tundrae]
MEMDLPSDRPHGAAPAVAPVNAPDPASWSSAREALQEIAWLHEVQPETLDALAAEALLHRVPAGSVLLEQAETPVFAQFLLAGSIELLGIRNQVETLIELLLPVDLVIPAAVIGDQPYLMRARVYEEAHLLLIRAEAFREAIASDHAFCRAILGRQAAQFRRQVRMQKNLKLRSAEERVGCYLVALFGQSHTDIVRLPLEKRLIASQLGMTRETFSRALAGMAKFGMLIRGDVLHIEDAAAARARFPLDPLIDGPEPIKPFQDRKA